MIAYSGILPFRIGPVIQALLFELIFVPSTEMRCVGHGGSFEIDEVETEAVDGGDHSDKASI
ncbi:hypothetical protein [Devosia riboflavina]